MKTTRSIGQFFLALFFISLICHAAQVTFSGSGLIVPQYFHNGWYQFPAPVLVNRTTSGGSFAYTTFHDSIYGTTTNATIVTDVQWGTPITDPNLPTNYPIAYTSGNGNVTAPTSITNTLWTYVSPGAYSLTATTAVQTNTVTGTVSTSTATSTTFYYPQTNSVNFTNSLTIDAMIAGKTPGTTTQNRFSSYTASVTNMNGNTFTPNANLFCKAVDTTCVGIYSDNNGSYGTKFQPTAISPRHCIGPAHAPMAGNSTVHVNFVDSNGATVTRTIIGGKLAADDVWIYLLDSDLPGTVTPAKLLPSTWASYLSLGSATATNRMAVPVIYCNQIMQIEVGEAYFVSSSSTNPQISYQQSSFSQRNAFNNWQLVSGDSGFTAGMVIGGAYVPISEWHYGGYGSGPFLSAYLTQINSAMSSLSTAAGLTAGETSNGGPYQVQTVSLSGYSTY